NPLKIRSRQSALLATTEPSCATTRFIPWRPSIPRRITAKKSGAAIASPLLYFRRGKISETISSRCSEGSGALPVAQLGRLSDSSARDTSPAAIGQRSPSPFEYRHRPRPRGKRGLSHEVSRQSGPQSRRHGVFAELIFRSAGENGVGLVEVFFMSAPFF